MRRVPWIGLMALTFLAPTPAAAAATRPAPVVLILLENHAYDQIVGSPSAPYLNGTFIPGGKLFSRYRALTHPSLPNYLAITSGASQGCTSDACRVGSFTADNLFHQLQTAGLSWRSWEESMQTPCQARSRGLYVTKHNPAVYYADLASTCTADDVAYPGAPPGSLPSFTFVTPNVCDDMHSCPVASGDAWLKAHVPALRAAGAEVIVTFDEGVSSDQHILTAEVGPTVAAGSVDASAYTHYGLLAGLERHFGLPRLGAAASAAALPV